MAKTALVTGASRGIGREWAGVDAVVNNNRRIGPGLMDTVLDTPIERSAPLVEAPAIAPIRIAQLLLASMLARGGGPS